MKGLSRVSLASAPLLHLVVVLGQALAFAGTLTLFSDTFNSYDPSLQLAVQGGWVQDPNFTAVPRHN